MCMLGWGASKSIVFHVWALSEDWTLRLDFQQENDLNNKYEQHNVPVKKRMVRWVIYLKYYYIY
jgi:hypothetical protein